MVRSGRRTGRPAIRNPSNACGDVTSWTRCRSMYSRSGSPSALRTTCRSHTFSLSVFGGFAIAVSHILGYRSRLVERTSSISGVGVLDKAMLILGALGDGRHRTLGELQAATGLPRATA